MAENGSSIFHSIIGQKSVQTVKHLFGLLFEFGLKGTLQMNQSNQSLKCLYNKISKWDIAHRYHLYHWDKGGSENRKKAGNKKILMIWSDGRRKFQWYS